jgi:hypothetical protein
MKRNMYLYYTSLVDSDILVSTRNIRRLVTITLIDIYNSYMLLN